METLLRKFTRISKSSKDYASSSQQTLTRKENAKSVLAAKETVSIDSVSLKKSNVEISELSSKEETHSTLENSSTTENSHESVMVSKSR